MTSSPNALSPIECAELIRLSENIVALSGAGISTEAGIPDFRGPRGLYVTRRYDPDLVFNLAHFQRDPSPFYRFTYDFMDMMKTVRPTFTHRFLASLEQMGQLQGVVTQNIDALHRHAGTRKIVEVHGSYWSAACTRCTSFSISGATTAWWSEAVRTSLRSPVVCCPKCGGVVKPDVVFFGEAVHGFDEAMAMVSGSDLLLVLGSSLTVYPAAMLPLAAKGNIVVVTSGKVGLSPGSNRFFVASDLDRFFRSVAGELGIAVSPGVEIPPQSALSPPE
jgi:NAD-dependent deacetylase